MTTLLDARFDALRAQGFTGAVNDMMVQWLQANGATSGVLADAWLEMLEANGIPAPANRTDGWYTLLGELGFTDGHINDREKAFWEAGGHIGPAD